MATEIERKFLVKGDTWKSQIYASKQIVQGYLSLVPERTVRVRLSGAKGVLTVKGKSEGISRAEFEFEIPKEEAGQLLRICEGSLINKTRYFIRQGKFIWEVDEFHDENKGLMVAEIELNSELEDFDRPDWLGEEVSHDNRYFNASLVQHPFSQWKHDEAS